MFIWQGLVCSDNILMLNFCFRDLKIENLLLDEFRDIKLIGKTNLVVFEIEYWSHEGQLCPAQSDQNLLGRILDSQGCKVSLCEQRILWSDFRWCVGWFKSSLGAHVGRYVFSRRGSFTCLSATREKVLNKLPDIKHPGLIYSKLTMSLVNISLKLWSLNVAYVLIFAEKIYE